MESDSAKNLLANIEWWTGFILPIVLSFGLGFVPMADLKKAKICFCSALWYAIGIAWLWLIWYAQWSVFLRVLLVLLLVEAGILIHWAIVLYVDSKKPPEPNIQCLRELDIDVELTSRQVFVESSSFDTPLRAFGIIVQNRSKPPAKVSAIEDVQAEILFYDLDFPENEYENHRVHRACWVGELGYKVSLPIDVPKYLLCGVFETRSEKEVGYRDRFTAYGHPEDDADELSTYTWSNSHGALIKIKLSAGLNGEFGKTFDCELRIDSSDVTKYGVHFTFVWLSDEVKKERYAEQLSQFAALIKRGERILTESTGVYDRDLWDKIHRWRDDSLGFIRRSYGLRPDYRLTSSEDVQIYHEPKNDHSFVNEFFTQIQRLKEMEKELRRDRTVK